MGKKVEGKRSLATMELLKLEEETATYQWRLKG